MTAPSKVMDNTKASEAAVALKEAGNKCYKDDDNEGALIDYTKAIEASEELNDEKLLATCLKNRAAVYLKYEDFELVVSDCTRALELVPNDPKSLFRRCQAHEGNNALQISFPHLLSFSINNVNPLKSQLQKSSFLKCQDFSNHFLFAGSFC